MQNYFSKFRDPSRMEIKSSDPITSASDPTSPLETFTFSHDRTSAARREASRKLAAGIPHTSQHDYISPLSSEIYLPGNSLAEEKNEIVFYSLFNELSFSAPARPLKVLVLTSIRDIAVEEHVGRIVSTSNGPSYMKGIVEFLFEASQNSLKPFIELAGVITDDLPQDLEGTGYAPTPSLKRPWIHPLHLKLGGQITPEEFTTNIPSTFRQLPRSAVRERAEGKLRFEEAIARHAEDLEADIILSDHFMAKIEYLIDPEYLGLFGRVLNIHPGISRLSHPYACRGKDPCREALLHAQGLLRDEMTGEIAEATPHHFTGASLHLVNKEFDAGPVLCEEESVPVIGDDTEFSLAAKINLRAKPKVTMLGLAHYASHLYPHRHHIAWDELREATGEDSSPAALDGL